MRRVAGPTVRELTLNDDALLPKAAAIFTEGLGDRYVSVEDLETKLDSADKRASIFGAFMLDELVGVITTNAVDSDLAFEIEQKSQQDKVVLPALSFHKTGLIQSLAVGFNWRRRGVGTILLERSLDHLRLHDSAGALAVSWVSGDLNSSKGVLEAADFESRYTITNYWEEESIEKGYACPSCESPCKCDAIIFYKPL